MLPGRFFFPGTDVAWELFFPGHRCCWGAFFSQGTGVAWEHFFFQGTGAAGELLSGEVFFVFVFSEEPLFGGSFRRPSTDTD